MSDERPYDVVHPDGPTFIANGGLPCQCCDRIVAVAKDILVSIPFSVVCAECGYHISAVTIGECPYKVTG